MHTERCSSTSRHKYYTKGSRKEINRRILYIEIQQMWNMKYVIIVLKIGATRIITKGLKKHLEPMTGKRSIHSLQKTAIFGTSHIKQRVLQSETCSFSSEDHLCFKRSTRTKMPVTRDKMMTMMVTGCQAGKLK
jgi:hypothetical protein